MKFSHNCIENFITKHGFKIENLEDENNGLIFGEIRLSGNGMKAKLKYQLYQRILTIRETKSKIKSVENFKFFKLALLLLLSENLDKVDLFELEAVPNWRSDSKGTEFCLLCYYEQLGFKVVGTEQKQWISWFTALCKKSLGESDLKGSCLLCKCQKLGLKISTESQLGIIYNLRAKMEVVASNIVDILTNYYNEIC